MDGEIRSIPGDRLVSRILTRVRRRPRLGMSPDFFARFGMADPWTAPEFAGEEPAANDGMVFLSAQPYYAMMRRLAASRRRRERREAAFQARHSGGTLRAVARRWPGETAASLAVSRIARLALDEMTLPPVIAPVAAPVVAGTASVVAAAPGRRVSTAFTNRGSSAWWSTPFVSARVFGGSARAESAAAAASAAPAAPKRATSASHAGARLAAAASATSPAVRALAEAIPSAVGVRRRQLTQIVTAIETLPAEEQEIQVRRVVRRLGASAPVVRSVFEDVAPEAAPAGRPAARPSQVAARRADPAASAGLRPVLSRSPAMALASAPEVDRAASGTLATAERSAERSGSTASLGRLPRRAASAQRALARGAAAPGAGTSSVPAPLSYARAVTTQALSASPVLRAAPAAAPRGAAPRPSARPSARPGSSRAPAPALYFGEDLSAATAPARRPSSARAVARLAASPVDPVFAPRAEAAQGAVRTTEGTWVAAREVAPARRDASVRPSVRLAPAASHAAARVDAGQVEGRSVLPRAIPAGPDRVLASLPAAPVVVAALSASPVARAERTAPAAVATAPTGSMPVRTARGAYVPARSSAGLAALAEAPVRSLAGRIEARSPRAEVGAPSQLAPASPGSGSPASSSGRAAGERLATGPLRSDAGAPNPGAPRPSFAGTLGASAFRTAEPASAPVAGSASPEATPTARAAARTGSVTPPPAFARPSGVVHAASRAEAPSAVPARRGVATFEPAVLARPAATASPTTPSAGPGSTPAGAASRAARAERPLHGERATRSERPTRGELRAAAVRSPAMAHASARSEVPVEGATLQPQVSPVGTQPGSRSVVPASRGSRVATVAAAARVYAAPLFSATGARVLSEGGMPSAAPAPARSRFARSGPLSFALPPLSPAPSVVAAASAERTRAPARSRVRASRVYTTPASAYSPSSAVTTPSGVWISARTAAAMPGLRILRTESGRLVALAPAPESPSAGPGRAPSASPGVAPAPRATRAPATAAATFARPYVPPVDDAADALVAPAPASRQRASDWAAQRNRVGEATAYRGAYRTVEPVGSTAQVFTTPEGARVFTPDGEGAGAPVSRTPARRDRPRRVSAQAMAGDMALPTQAPAAGVAAPASGAAARTRTPLDERLHGVAVGVPDSGSPSWAARSDGAPRVRSPGGLFEALARATSTEEIVRVIYARADGVRETPLAQEAPVVQVIEQIRQEVRQEVRRDQAAADGATRSSRLGAPSATTIQGSYVQPVKSTTRVNRGGVRAVGATARSVAAGSGDDRITKLVKKLQGLIHLAEAEGRLADARSQVRMAEDSAAARAEGQGPVGTSKEGGEKGQKQDIDALGREVLEVVTRELEFRRSRRTEDHDESSWW